MLSDSYQQRSINHVTGGQCMFWFAVLTPWTVAPQALLFMGFSRQEYLSGLLFPSPGDLPDPGIKHGSPELAGGYCLSHEESPLAILCYVCLQMLFHVCIKINHHSWGQRMLTKVHKYLWVVLWLGRRNNCKTKSESFWWLRGFMGERADVYVEAWGGFPGFGDLAFSNRRSSNCWRVR